MQEVADKRFKEWKEQRWERENEVEEEAWFLVNMLKF